MARKMQENRKIFDKTITNLPVLKICLELGPFLHPQLPQLAKELKFLPGRVGTKRNFFGIFYPWSHTKMWEVKEPPGCVTKNYPNSA